VSVKSVRHFERFPNSLYVLHEYYMKSLISMAFESIYFMLNYCGYVSGREKKLTDWLMCYSGQSTVLGSEFQMEIDKERNDPTFNYICIPRPGCLL
jgi:hypothetical protein